MYKKIGQTNLAKKLDRKFGQKIWPKKLEKKFGQKTGKKFGQAFFAINQLFC